ncbi:MAG: ATP-binding protein [Bacteroidota bacterium]
MKLKTKYILFVTIVHLVCLVMSYFVFEKDAFVFMLSEALIILSVIISLNLYKQLVQPLSYLKEGISAIKDKDFNVKFLFTGKQEVDQLVDVYNRMIDELRTERTKQQEQHFFLEKLIQTSPTGIIVLDYNDQVKQINPKAKEILGSNAIVILDQLNLIKPGSSKTIKLDGLRSYKVQKSKFIDRGFERNFIMMEELTAEIVEAEKNVYNKVIRMMAHEVNNTIGPVNSIMNMALINCQKNNADITLQNALQVAIDRNYNLNGFMRNFAELVKLPEAQIQQIDVLPLLKSVIDLSKYGVKDKTIQFNLVLPEAPYLIKADARLLEQALINIFKNAIEAIDLTGAVNVCLNQSNGELVISDNGKGIAENDVDQLFSPFFSTKKDGQGIGLTLVREILVNHGFEFSLKTVSKNCTEFRILLG